MGFALLFIVGVGGLCYPRHPRATGVIFMLIGAALLAAWTTGAIGGARNGILFAAGNWIACGSWIVWKFRTSFARVAHLAAWTGKS
jgi:hypothetical protein